MLSGSKFYIVNAITLYRLAAAFFLLYLVVTNQQKWFQWLLAISFFTDAVDGFLARRWEVVSEIGSRLDSIADDLTVLIAIISMCVFKPEFVWAQMPLILVLSGLYLVQLAFAFIRYGKPTSFHTYLAKLAAVMQGIFLVLLFFLPQPLTGLFYVAAAITLLDLLEELVMIFLLPTWQSDVKGIYWLRKKERNKDNS